MTQFQTMLCQTALYQVLSKNRALPNRSYVLPKSALPNFAPPRYARPSCTLPNRALPICALPRDTLPNYAPPNNALPNYAQLAGAMLFLPDHYQPALGQNALYQTVLDQTLLRGGALPLPRPSKLFSAKLPRTKLCSTRLRSTIVRSTKHSPTNLCSTEGCSTEGRSSTAATRLGSAKLRSTSTLRSSECALPCALSICPGLCTAKPNSRAMHANKYVFSSTDFSRNRNNHRIRQPANLMQVFRLHVSGRRLTQQDRYIMHTHGMSTMAAGVSTEAVNK